MSLRVQPYAYSIPKKSNASNPNRSNTPQYNLNSQSVNFGDADPRPTASYESKMKIMRDYYHEGQLAGTPERVFGVIHDMATKLIDRDLETKKVSFNEGTRVDKTQYVEFMSGFVRNTPNYEKLSDPNRAIANFISNGMGSKSIPEPKSWFKSGGCTSEFAKLKAIMNFTYDNLIKTGIVKLKI